MAIRQSLSRHPVTALTAVVLTVLSTVGLLLAEATPATAAEIGTAEIDATQTGATRTGADGTVLRLAGASRFDTAVAISQDLFDDASTDAAVLVTGAGFADALPGTVLARAVGGPLLLTHTDVLPAPTRAELQRVLGGRGTVWLVGGAAVIGESIAAALTDLGYDVRRIAGDSRFQTGAGVAAAIPSPTGVLLADGGRFTDGLVAAAAAAGSGGVLLLTAGDQLDRDTRAQLDAMDGVPSTAVGVAAATAVPEAAAVVGRTPSHTSRLVAQLFHPSATAVGVASDADFPDGLAGGLHAALRGGPLLLTKPDRLDVPVLGHLDELGLDGTLTTAWVYGGPSALEEAVLAQVEEEVLGDTRTIHTVAPRLCLDRSGAPAPHLILERACDTGHEYEVYATFEHPDDRPTHPGDDAVQAHATEQCTGQVFTDYVGVPYEESRWFVSVSTPTVDGWADGDRGIACMVYDIRGPKDTSVYDSRQ